MAHMMLREILIVILVLLTCHTYSVQSQAQTCTTYSFSTNTTFKNCRDLPHQTSFLHWTYDQVTGKLDIGFRHGGLTSSSSNNRWVAWAINPNNDLTNAMLGAQALVALSQSYTSTPTVYTTSITHDYYASNQLQQRSISYNVTGLSTTRQDDEIHIFATIMLPSGTTSLVHLWQNGPLSGSTPQQHNLGSDNIEAKETLDLVSGQTQAAASTDSVKRKRIVHGVLNCVSWGVLLPIGAIIARYMKVFKSADPAWFYLHVTTQTTAYVVGVGGWGLGLKLGSDSVGVEYTTHRTLGFILFCLGTLQVFALFLRPNKDHKYRLYWNVYHLVVGYATIIISIVNIFEGFDALKKSEGDDYTHWKTAYIVFIAALGGIALLLEIFTWILVMKRRKSETVPRGVERVNEVNNVGYGSKSPRV